MYGYVLYKQCRRCQFDIWQSAESSWRANFERSRKYSMDDGLSDVYSYISINCMHVKYLMHLKNQFFLEKKKHVSVCGCNIARIQNSRHWSTRCSIFLKLFFKTISKDQIKQKLSKLSKLNFVFEYFFFNFTNIFPAELLGKRSSFNEFDLARQVFVEFRNSILLLAHTLSLYLSGAKCCPMNARSCC